MEILLQTHGQTCPAAPGVSLDIAISLLQMSVLGLPLLLALFQFVNDHEYPEPEDQISKRTVVYSIVMMVSALTLWGFYFTAFCVIQTNLGANSLTNLLFVFMWVLLAIILVILLIQLEQMVGKGFRYPLATYLTASGLVASAVFQDSLIIRATLILAAIVSVTLGLVSQHIGLEQAGEKAGERIVMAWRTRESAKEEDKKPTDE